MYGHKIIEYVQQQKISNDDQIENFNSKTESIGLDCAIGNSHLTNRL